MTNPYTISLLNDLHNHFPDLLYRPQQFQSVQDVLQYIIGVANQNPYERARNTYLQQNNVQQSSQTNARSYFNISPENIAIRPSNVLLSTVPRSRERSLNSFLQNLQSSNSVERIVNEFIQSLGPIRSRAPNPSDFPSDVWAQMHDFDLRPYLQENVPVHPTSEQIEAGSILLTANQVNQDNCAICQDPMEIGQSIRMLRHCMHRFHQTCIDPWLTNHTTCPTCRHDIRNQSESSE